jgi:hypothetical protein
LKILTKIVKYDKNMNYENIGKCRKR